MVNDSETEGNQKKKQEESRLVNFFTNPNKLFRLSAGLIVFALLSPLVFTKISTGIVFDSDVTKISNGISIMSPFIAIAAAIITFAAFWKQYEANQELRKQAEKDREDNQNERDNAEIRIRKQQIISRFYEMLQIHRENVKELEWNQSFHYEEGNSSQSQVECVQKRGRQIFFYYLIEFNFIYNLIKGLYPELDIKERVKKAYNIFYKNVDDKRLSYEKRKEINKFIQNDEYQLANGIFSICNIFGYYQIDSKDLDQLIDNKDYFKLQPLFKGHFDELNNYYRHLFLTVKTIANENKKKLKNKENKDDLSYEEKRDLLRILRAQLTNTEQIMLFYNWFSENGSQWEQDNPNGNHFFTKYRMVHNIMPSRIIPTHFFWGVRDEYQNLIDYLGTQPIYSYIKEYCSKDDPMFEFEDWDGCPKFNYDK